MIRQRQSFPPFKWLHRLWVSFVFAALGNQSTSYSRRAWEPLQFQFQLLNYHWLVQIGSPDRDRGKQQIPRWPIASPQVHGRGPFPVTKAAPLQALKVRSADPFRPWEHTTNLLESHSKNSGCLIPAKNDYCIWSNERDVREHHLQQGFKLHVTRVWWLIVLNLTPLPKKWSHLK